MGRSLGEGQAQQRVVIVGGESVGRLHAQAVQQVRTAELAGFVGGKGAKVNASEFRANHYGTLHQAAAPGVDIAVICTPTATHAHFGLEAVRLGMHVLVEKAIDTSAVAARSLVDCARAQGVTLGVVSQGQFEDSFQHVLDAVGSGRLGTLTLGSISRKCWRDADYYRGWHGTQALDGGGALINQTIHKVDQLCRLMGPARRVTGLTRTQAHPIEVEDTALALVEFQNGAVGTIEATTAFFSGGSNLSEQTGVDTLHVSGTLGAATIDKGILSRSWADEAAAAPPGPVHRGPAVELFVRQHQDFIEAIMTGRRPRVTGEDGLRALELVLAVYASARVGEPVEIGDIDAIS